MSEEKKLTVEELQKLSPSQLRNIIPGLEGEEKVLAQTVLDKKLEKTKGIREIPGVAAEVEFSEENANSVKKETSEEEAKKSDAEERKRLREEARLKAEAEKQRVKAELEAKKQEKIAEREKLRELALQQKEERLRQKAEAEAKKLEGRDEKIKKLEEAKKLRKEEALAKKEQKEQAKLDKKKAEDERVAAVAARLREVEVSTKEGSKTDLIKRLMMEGKSNPEIAKETGLGIKFVCDNVWRIMRQLEAAEWLANNKKSKTKEDGSVEEKTE